MLKFDRILLENMTEDGYKLWKKLEEKIPNIWNKLSSSSNKYHKKENGESDTIEDHTMEMIFSAIKLLSVFDIKPKTKDCDVILLGITLHDSCKYGLENPLERLHTVPNHGHLISDLINLSKNTFLKHFSNDEVLLLEEITRFHDGRWGNDWKNEDMSWKKLDSKILMVHFLDMASTNNLLKVPINMEK